MYKKENGYSDSVSDSEVTLIIFLQYSIDILEIYPLLSSMPCFDVVSIVCVFFFSSE